MPLAPYFDALPGAWATVRVLRHAGGGVARFQGTTVWQPEGDHLRCEERGRLIQDGRSFEARRATLWTRTGSAVEVRFEDGRPFHVVDGPDAAHDCAPDRYDLRYDVSAWPRWSVRWRVAGPRKDYRALTRYRRAGRVDGSAG